MFIVCQRSILALGADIDKSLDLEKFSKRNDSQFSLSRWRSEFSYLVLLLIFTLLKMYNYLGVVYIVEPATSEIKALIEKDKFVRKEMLIPAVSKKFTFIQFPPPFYHVFFLTSI